MKSYIIFRESTVELTDDHETVILIKDDKNFKQKLEEHMRRSLKRFFRGGK